MKRSAAAVSGSDGSCRRVGERILVEEPALAQAEQECMSDADARMRRRERDQARRADLDVEFQERMAAEIGRIFPGCPAPRATQIAERAGERGSGRVGRSAAGRALDEQAMTLAVVASVRHQDTDYDSLLMAGLSRAEARDHVRPAIDEILATWQTPRHQMHP
jgi:hypothetical protein